MRGSYGRTSQYVYAILRCQAGGDARAAALGLAIALSSLLRRDGLREQRTTSGWSGTRRFRCPCDPYSVDSPRQRHDGRHGTPRAAGQGRLRCLVPQRKTLQRPRAPRRGDAATLADSGDLAVLHLQGIQTTHGGAAHLVGPARRAFRGGPAVGAVLVVSALYGRSVCGHRAHERGTPYSLLVCRDGALPAALADTFRHSFQPYRPSGRLSRYPAALLRLRGRGAALHARRIECHMGADH